MIKIIFLLKRKQGLTLAEFRNYYEENHVKLAYKLHSDLIVDYRRNYVKSAIHDPSSTPPGQTPPAYDIGYDCITEMWVKDEAALEEMARRMNDPKINPVIVQDESNFMERPAIVQVFVDEVRSSPRAG